MESSISQSCSSSYTVNNGMYATVKLKWIKASESGDNINPQYQTPQIKNHTATLYKKMLYVFGGYDGKKNHSSLRIFNTETYQWMKAKRPTG